MHSVEMTTYHLFSREANEKCWKIIRKFPKTCFSELCASLEQYGGLFDQLEDLFALRMVQMLKKCQQCKIEEI